MAELEQYVLLSEFLERYRRYFTFSARSPEPVSYYYDGDGKADYAIRQSFFSNWIIRKSGSSTSDTICCRCSGDTSVRKDYDADGKCDIIAVCRQTDSPQAPSATGISSILKCWSNSLGPERNY